MASRFYTRRRLGACYVWDVKVVLKVKSHELRMCEPKLNSWKILRNLAKTRRRPQVVEPAMAVKHGIRVAKGRFLISKSIRKSGLRDIDVFFFFSKRRYSSRDLVWNWMKDMKVPATEISQHICIFSCLYILNIFSLKLAENKDIKPGREKHSYKKECTSEIRSI